MNERAVETLIDEQLKNLGWDNSNVYRQQPKTEQQKQDLGRRRPDYVLYRKDSDFPIAIIEAKKPHENLDKAISQGIDYAEALKVPIVFATDGIFTKSYHTKAKKPLYLNKEEVDDLLKYSTALNYIETNEYYTLDKNIIKSRDELISIFSRLNNNFRDAGVRSGMARIELFCNMLFLKVIDELASQENSLIKQLPSWCRWNKIREKKGEELLAFINGDAFNHFKGAYDGEVLSPISGLLKYNILNKVVDELDNLHLSSTDTDIKGDAFEYFLRNYGGAETDFGEYFTPRHIVKALVKILNPKFGESVYDPFCGTGGMLINSFKHIHQRMPINEQNIEYLKKKTIYGGELTDMFRVAKMNMILTGDGHSNINRQDSYERKQTGKHDVVITNIPFGKKMKTKYAVNYGYNTKSAEIAGVLHCLDALSDTSESRTGILVPEGVLFDGSKAYTALRQQIVEKHSLESVISLPSGLFGKNTGVKSNILVIKKQSNKSKNHIWYFNVENDGFTLDSKRQKISGQNDIDTVLSEKKLTVDDKDRLEKLGFSVLYKEEIKENKYVLLANHYKKQDFSKNKHDFVKLEDVILDIKDGGTPPRNQQDSHKYFNGNINWCVVKDIKDEIYDTNEKLTELGLSKCSAKLWEIDSIIISLGATIGNVGIAKKPTATKQGLSGIIVNKNKVLPKYLMYVLKSQKEKLNSMASGSTIKEIRPSKLKKELYIPLLSLKEQEKIVEELDSYQNIIDSAKKIVDSYYPYFEIDDKWELMNLDNLCNIISGGTPDTKNKEYWNGNIYWSTLVDTKTKYLHKTQRRITQEGLTNSGAKLLPINTVLFSSRATIGEVSIAKVEVSSNQGYKNFVCKDTNTLYYEYLYYIFLIKKEDIKNLASGTTYLEISKESISNYEIPLPPIEIQHQIVEKLEKEGLMIEQQKELIKYFEQKIQDRLNSLWESPTNNTDNQELVAE